MFYDPALLVPHALTLLASAVLVLLAWRIPRLARVLFLLLFAGAGIVNWVTVLEKPEVYLNYAPLSLSVYYRTFILGFFVAHERLIVGAIATSQFLIAAGLALGGELARGALLGAIVFLIDIAPLGAGSAFPSTLLMALAAGVLLTPARRAALQGAVGRPVADLARGAQDPS